MRFKLDKFEGPLDLLLDLITKQRLEITEISLTDVTDQYLEYLESNPELPPESIADFLSIASKLILLKSRSLIPSISLDDEEEEDLNDLAERLRVYGEYKRLASNLETLLAKKQIALSRPWRKDSRSAFYAPDDLTVEEIGKLYFDFARSEEEFFVDKEKESIKDTVSIDKKIDLIKNKIGERIKLSFSEVAGKESGSTGQIVSFLAVLELSKQKILNVKQEKMFGEIFLSRRVE